MADHFDPIFDPRVEPPRTWEDRLLEREEASEELAYRLAEEWRASQAGYDPTEAPDFGPHYRDSYTPSTGYTPPPKETAP